MSQPDAPGKLGYAEMMARTGMGSAWSRCFVAGVGVAALLYCVGFPKEGFREDGSIRPCSLLTPGPDGVLSKHFLVAPLVVATAVVLFS
jgi:hypothetical protein